MSVIILPELTPSTTRPYLEAPALLETGTNLAECVATYHTGGVGDAQHTFLQRVAADAMRDVDPRYWGVSYREGSSVVYSNVEYRREFNTVIERVGDPDLDILFNAYRASDGAWGRGKLLDYVRGNWGIISLTMGVGVIDGVKQPIRGRVEKLIRDDVLNRLSQAEMGTDSSAILAPWGRLLIGAVEFRRNLAAATYPYIDAGEE